MGQDAVVPQKIARNRLAKPSVFDPDGGVDHCSVHVTGLIHRRIGEFRSPCVKRVARANTKILHWVPNLSSRHPHRHEMNHIKRFFWAIFSSTGSRWFTHGLRWQPCHFSARGSLLMQYSGVLGIGVMSAAMILAVRPVLFEPYLGGLDKTIDCTNGWGYRVWPFQSATGRRQTRRTERSRCT